MFGTKKFQCLACGHNIHARLYSWRSQFCWMAKKAFRCHTKIKIEILDCFLVSAKEGSVVRKIRKKLLHFYREIKIETWNICRRLRWKGQFKIQIFGFLWDIKKFLKWAQTFTVTLIPICVCYLNISLEYLITWMCFHTKYLILENNYLVLEDQVLQDFNQFHMQAWFQAPLAATDFY